MRKSLLILLQIIMFAMPLFAERVDEKTAQKVGETFLKSKMPGKTDLKLTQVAYANRADFSNFYVFGGENCFVIVSAEDCVQPILGYSKTDTFCAVDMPESIRYWLQGYNDQIQAAIDSKVLPKADVLAQWKDLTNGNSGAVKSDIIVDALIQTTWDQGAPYNNLCPLALNGNGQLERCVTGCVATAMAQVIKFWNHPVVGVGSHSYTPTYSGGGHQTYYGTTMGQLEADFYSTHYDWNHMPNAPTTSSPDIEQNAVATLMYHCGVAVNMMYDISVVGGSGAYSGDVPAALKTYFNFSNSTNGKYRRDYTDEAWKTLLKTELNNYRPIYYSGNGSGGGHAFVCDGYDSEDKFHFNWGWSGFCDGFYAINNLAPGTGGIGSGSTGDFNNGNYAIFGIEPNYSSANPPTNLVGSLEGRSVSLSWSAATGAVSYNVYRNNAIIASNVISTSCCDNLMPYGTNRYYVRSVDSEGNLSESSNVVEFTLVFFAPTNLTAVINNDESVSLSWDDESELAVSYNIYCNDEIIGSSNLTSFSHSTVPFGEVFYYVKSVDSYGVESLQSNVVTLTHSFGGPFVTDLTATLNDNSVSFSWTEPTSESGTLQYGALISGSYGAVGYNGSDTYWAEAFPATQLVLYAGMAITSVKNYFHSAGDYELIIYSSASMESLLGISFNIPSPGFYTIPISSAVPLDFTHDMWIVFHAFSNVQHPAVYVNYSGDCTNAAYLSSNGSSWSQYGSGISWVFQISVTDGTYTYNLYDGETKLNGSVPITGNSYVVSNVSDNAAHCYTLKTNYYGGESNSSNMVGYTLGEASLPSLSLGSNDKMTVKQNARLSVSGTLVNINPDNLILEDNAQLIHSTSGVYATLQKSITGFGTDNGNWYLVASPMVGNVSTAPFVSDYYDLYRYNEPTHYWWNSKAPVSGEGENGEDHHFDELTNGTGYLYANRVDKPVVLSGELQPSNNPVAVSLSYTASLPALKGFNLVGNPFPCKAMLMDGNIASDFYVMKEGGNQLELATENVINPFEGIFVQATGENANATFSRYAAPAKSQRMPASFDITINEGRSEIDRARVRLGEGMGLGKFSLNENSARIYIPMDKQDYASVYVSGRNVLPLNFKPAHNGTYTLNFDLANVDLAYLHLIDNLTGADVDLMGAAASTSSASYSFDAKTTDYASRFKLVFAEKQQSDETDDSDFMYFADGQMFVFGAEENSIIQIVDATGRIVLNENVKGFVNKSLSLKPGVYVARMICGGAVKTQKFVAE